MRVWLIACALRSVLSCPHSRFEFDIIGSFRTAASAALWGSSSIFFPPLALFPISFGYILQIAKQWEEIKTQKAHQVNGGEWLEFSATGVTSAWRKKSVTSREEKTSWKFCEVENSFTSHGRFFPIGDFIVSCLNVFDVLYRRALSVQMAK